ncbi:MAG: hypothetical protein FJ147_23285 [Deltaproteobacteria bacterium]|nr:hypothetical protein [Deltaproteobacteria bacterium]
MSQVASKKEDRVLIPSVVVCLVVGLLCWSSMGCSMKHLAEVVAVDVDSPVLTEFLNRKPPSVTQVLVVQVSALHGG